MVKILFPNHTVLGSFSFRSLGPTKSLWTYFGRWKVKEVHSAGDLYIAEPGRCLGDRSCENIWSIMLRATHFNNVNPSITDLSVCSRPRFSSKRNGQRLTFDLSTMSPISMIERFFFSLFHLLLILFSLFLNLVHPSLCKIPVFTYFYSLHHYFPAHPLL